MVSTTSEESMMEPSTIASGESGSRPTLTQLVASALLLLQLDELDRGGADIKPDEIFAL